MSGLASIRAGVLMSMLGVWGLGCGPQIVPSSGGDTASSETTHGSASTVSTTSSGTSVGSTSDGAETSTGPASTSSSGSVDDSSSSGAGCDRHPIIDCDGTIFDCGNGVDDDGDGLIDLEDPDCLHPCDHDEYYLPPRYPADFRTCELDCAFDESPWSSNDQCRFDSTCDPMTPPGFYCSYQGPSGCSGLPEIGEQCQSGCEPNVPNGCDCFGCCTIMTDAGPVDRLVGADWVTGPCTLDDLDACPACTLQIELCGNPCEECELCFGDSEPSGACESLACVGGTPCESRCDCGPDEYCKTGCCMPEP